ncbi:MAG TPA: amidohydrolase family protein, partial [Xanthobacteraceae bacterium]|nr:amidohydrolase family protein [Xanthobacteraceae bacterium]
MLKKPNCPVIAIEEHYWDRELSATYSGVEGVRNPQMMEQLHDLGDLRLKEMDEAGVDIQIISHGAPSAQKLSGDDAVALVRRVNDRLAAAIAKHPTRFAGFATLPTSDPAAAADELERAVTKLGFKGAMIHGLANGLFLDDKRFWPIFERAEKLDVPIYLHPALPHPQVMDVYYKEYAKDFPMVIRAAWGFTVETATIAIRLVLGGV